MESERKGSTLWIQHAGEEKQSSRESIRLACLPQIYEGRGEPPGIQTRIRFGKNPISPEPGNNRLHLMTVDAYRERS